jgi:hypothetical protein
VVGGGIRELEYLIIYYEKKYFFLSSTKSHTYVPCGGTFPVFCFCFLFHFIIFHFSEI